MKKSIIFILASIVFGLLLHATTAHADTFDNTTAFGINGPALSVSLVNQDPDPAVAGDTLDLRLGVLNGGQTAVNNVAIELVPSYPFTLVSTQQPIQNIGTIDGYQGQYNNNQQIVKYTVLVDKDAPAGSYDLKVNIHQSNSAAVIQQKIAVDVRGQQSAEIIHIDKSVVIPGQLTPITFTINNVGTSPLRDLTFSWQDENNVILPVGSDNTQYIKYIDVGQSANVEYHVVADTNANPGLYKLNLHLSYTDPTKGVQNVSTVAGVYVGGGTDFEVAYSDSTSGTSFSVANTGSNPAYSVSVIIPEQPGWHVTGSNTQIIGNLNKGDYTIASFNLNGMNSTGRRGGNPQYAFGNETFTRNSTMVRVQIAYSDTTGQRQVVEKLVQVGMGGALGTNGRFAQQQTSSNTIWYVIAIVLIVGGFFGYRWYNKRKTEPKRR